MGANESLHTPSHYTSSFQHWDLCIKIPLGYLEGCATKYVTRWRKKDGIQDLYKARHYLDKLMEIATYDALSSTLRWLTIDEIKRLVAHYSNVNHLNHLERAFILAVCTYSRLNDLKQAQTILSKMIVDALIDEEEPPRETNKPGTPEDGGHHARYEES